MTIQITQVQPQELPILRNISIQTFKDTFDDLNTAEDMDRYISESLNEEKLTMELNHSDSMFFFARVDAQLAGYLKVNKGTAQTESVSPGALEIERIYVLREFHGSGIGKRLLDHALEVASSLRVDLVWLGVWERNTKAIDFYARHGFETFGSHVFRLGSDAQTDVLMRRYLSPHLKT